MKCLVPVLLVLLTALSAAQTSNVTATITDPDSQTWNNGTYTINFIPTPGVPGPYTWNGGQPFTQQFRGAMNGSGIITQAIPSSNFISPSGSQWQFTLCSNSSAPCQNVVTSVTGASPNLSSVLSAPLVAPRFQAGQYSFGYLDVEVQGPNGGALLPGIQYWNVTNQVTRQWNGIAWQNLSGGGGGTPAGPNGAVQYDNAGAFGAIVSTGLGSTLVSNGTLVPPIYRSNPQIDMRDGFGGSGGVDCTGTIDSTTAVQAMINNAPDYSSFLAPAGCKIKVSGSTAITIDSRYGLQFVFQGRNGNACLSSTTPAQFIYSQAYGAGNRVLYINRSQDLEFRNVMINVNGGGDIGLDIDQVGGTPPITTRNDFSYLCIANQVAANANFKGVRVSNTSTNNVENIHFYHPDVLCSSAAPTSSSSNGFGIWFGNNPNHKNEIVEDMRSTNCSVTTSTQFGSDLTTRDGLESSSWIANQMGGFNDFLSGFRTEADHNSVQIVNAVGPHTLIHNDFASGVGTSVDCPSGCGIVNLIGNEQDTATPLTIDPHAGSGTLFAFGNRLVNIPVAGWTQAFVFGAQNFSTGSITGFENTWMASPMRMTNPSASAAGIGNSKPSPPLVFDSQWGSANYNHWFIQASSDQTGNSGLTLQPYGSVGFLGLGGTITGMVVGANPTTTMTVPSISIRGTPGATTWCYAIVANTVTGHSAIGTPTCSNTGNATLNGTNFWVITWDAYPGAVNYDVYRTTAGGTPNTTGKIGNVQAYWFQGGGTTAGNLSFSDQGGAGDGTTGPLTNTTGGSTFNATSTFNAAVNVNATITANTVTTSGANGGISATEGTGASVTPGAGIDILWADSTAHRWKMNNNNGGNQTVLGSNDWATPGTIGSTTPNTGAFTTLSGTTITSLAGPVSGTWNCVNVAPVTVTANTTNDQNLMTCTIPAGAINSVGRTLRIHSKSLYTTPIGSTATLTFKVKLCSVSGCGSGNVATLVNITSTANPGTITNNGVLFDAESTTQTGGAASRHEASGDLIIDLGAVPTSATSTFADTNTTTIAGSPADIDLTAQNFLQITVAFSVGSASNSVTERQLVVDTVD